MPTERSTSNGRRSKRPPTNRIAAASDVLDANQLLAVLSAVRKGDFSVKMPLTQVGIAGKISDALNDIIDLNRETTRELERVSQAVGKEGRITQRAHLQGAAGSWAASVDSVNTLIADLEKWLGYRFRDNPLDRYPTIAALSRFLAAETADDGPGGAK